MVERTAVSIRISANVRDAVIVIVRWPVGRVAGRVDDQTTVMPRFIRIRAEAETFMSVMAKRDPQLGRSDIDPTTEWARI